MHTYSQSGRTVHRDSQTNRKVHRDSQTNRKVHRDSQTDRKVHTYIRTGRKVHTDRLRNTQTQEGRKNIFRQTVTYCDIDRTHNQPERQEGKQPVRRGYKRDRKAQRQAFCYNISL